MMKFTKERSTGRLLGTACGVVASVLLYSGALAGETHDLPKAKKGVVVGLCDGKTSLEVADLAPGQRMSRDQAQSVSDQLMAEWQRKNPGAHWDQALAQGEVKATPRPATAPSSSRVSAGPTTATPAAKGQQGGIYEGFSSRDEMVWAHETQKFIDEGSAIFHSDKQLGGTIGVSCDMCHPNAANTHPETYPKYQAQLQRVALLRDMINWCIENPVKGRPMADDDPRMRALEAYIISQRKGIKLDYGKH